MKKIIFFLILTLIFCNVFFLDTYKSIIGDFGDNFEYLSFMHMAKENILAFKHPFADTNTLRYPTGFNFSFGFDGVLAVITGATLSIFFDPILSYNITVVLILFLNLVVSYFYFKKIAKLKENNPDIELKSFCCALIFGASAYVFARLNSHLNLAFVAGFPVLMYFMVILNKKIIQKDYILTKSDLHLFFGSILLIAFGSLQYLIMLVLTLPFFIFLAIKNHYFGIIVKLLKSNFKQILLSFILFILIFIYFYYGYILGITTKTISSAISSHKYFAPHILDFIIPNAYLGKMWELFNPSSKSIEKIYTVGVVEILLFAYVFFAKIPGKIKIWAGLFYLVYVFMSLNLIKIPYFPEPGRLVIFLSLYLCLVLLTQPDFIKNKAFLYFIFFVLFIQRLFFEIQSTAVYGADLFRSTIPQLGGEAVLNVPLDDLNAYRSSLPIFYKKKIFDGYFHYIAFNQKASQTLSQDYANRLVCALGTRNYNLSDKDRNDFYYWLKNQNVSSIVVFKEDSHGKFYFDECANARDFWYFVNPVSFILKQSSSGINKNTFEFFSFNSNNIAQFYFEKGGKFTVSKIFVAPAVIDDFSIKTPDGTIINPSWQKNDDGYLVDFNPVLEVNAKAGESIIISSPKKSNDNRYIFVYYSFESNAQSLLQIKPKYELIHNDNSYDIFKVN